MQRVPVAAFVSATLALLPPIAYADPPDAVDVHGVYDPSDDAASNAMAGQTAVLCAAPLALSVSLLAGGVAPSRRVRPPSSPRRPRTAARHPAFDSFQGATGQHRCEVGTGGSEGASMASTPQYDIVV